MFLHCLPVELFLFISCATAYAPLSDAFLGNVTAVNYDALLSPILIPRVPGSEGHTTVQHHVVDFFSANLPKWKMEWYNSTTKTEAGTEIPIANLVVRREPPWTKLGQANWLTLAAHYDSKTVPAGSVGAMDGATCAMLMHIASSIDPYATQMHTEMDALGEGGTVPMDMGVQLIFFDGKESLQGGEPALYGSKALSQTLEETFNPLGTRYETALSQINIFVMLDSLGAANPTVPSYLKSTTWAHRNMANLEQRMRTLGLLESSSSFFPSVEGDIQISEARSDYVPFMERGVPFLHVLPLPAAANSSATKDRIEGLSLPTVRDWSKIMVGFALEWLDMMEVWPE